MNKRFIVTLDSATDEQDMKFIDFIKENGLGWWHWISTNWMLVDPNGKFTAVTLRSSLMDIYPGVNMIVIELSADGDSWAGFGPSGNEKNMFTWLNNNWKS
ncbi:hypothetical protein [Klebsiella aerogenes]|uniref:hypothetical protein n=1 Tax=Klebsiella aerogenes TaxID=548 RepID=UPI002810911E|nr:hypothetical protein [Klebsiella aerogenes]EIV5415696.1 hypothetical protein [Klebsiella aerogenes]MDQ8572784.1 hypothetical protein [Klebsiella aerogenes]MDQ8600786.1 hypothetical protein [Klebsiella aerogenes]